jgi:hypothetical protein
VRTTVPKFKDFEEPKGAGEEYTKDLDQTSDWDLPEEE